MSTHLDDGPRPRGSPLKTAGLWLLGHGGRVAPFVVLASVLGVSWSALHQVRWHQVRVALGGMDPAWLGLAFAVTALNVIVMGLYDVSAFAATRSTAFERWRYGSVAFAWSNFLTLGPFSGPAIRFWLYRPTVNRPADLEAGVLSVTIAFVSGLTGWTIAAAAIAAATGAGSLAMAVMAFALALAGVTLGSRLLERTGRYRTRHAGRRELLALAAVGWLDWLLAGVAFLLCVRAAGPVAPVVDTVRWFFIGQAIGLASLVPGGFGSADAFWIAHLAGSASRSTAALLAYRFIYYVIPWAVASLMLLSWATRQASRRVEIARRSVAGLVGAGGVLMLLSTASPALQARLLVAERIIPLLLVEASTITAALAGLLLLVLARGLARGYRAALGLTIALLLLAAISAILKGLDYEEAMILAGLAVAAWSQAQLFDRETHGRWLDASDLLLAVLALALFIVFGIVAFHLTPAVFSRAADFGYHLERARFLRAAGTLALAVIVGAVYLLLRVPVRFERSTEEEIDRALARHARLGRDTSFLMVANGDKAIFADGDRGICLYRTIGPYVVVLADPAVRSPAEAADFLNALFAFAGEIDRTLVFYQVSPAWIPALHDRGYFFFKLGEEAHVPLARLTLEGHAGKMYRQILRRAERDHLRFRLLSPDEAGRRMGELAAVSHEWLVTKRMRERRFSIGFFDERYLRRFPCAVVEQWTGTGDDPSLVAFANLLPGPGGEELSVDLTRYRGDSSNVMDFLYVSLFLYGRAESYQRFNLGMAPLATVGQRRGAHIPEQLASLLFQHGEQWYNFQGLRSYKEKFDPEWVPRYLAYQNAWEWPAVITNVSALIAGGWGRIARPRRPDPDSVDGRLTASRPVPDTPIDRRLEQH